MPRFRPSPVLPSHLAGLSANLLTLRAPPGTVFQRQSGTDSFVGNLRGPGFVLHLDYGLFSPRPPDQAGLINQTVQELNLDDKPAKIVSGGVVASSPPKYFIGLYMADLRSPTASNPSSLAIYAELPTTDQDPLIRAIFTTIRFARR